MLPKMNGEFHQGSSSSSTPSSCSFAREHQTDQQQQESASVNGFDSSLLTSMQNFSLSDHSEVSAAMPYQNQQVLGSGASNLYNYASNYSPINDFVQPFDNNMGFDYYQPLLPATNFQDPSLGTGYYPPNNSIPRGDGVLFNSVPLNKQAPANYLKTGHPIPLRRYPRPGGFADLPISYEVAVVALEGFSKQPYSAMKNPHYSHVLLKLIDMFNGDLVESMVRTIVINPESLVEAACDPCGTRFVQRLIKVGRKCPYIGLLPQVLGMKDRVYNLMTNSTGRHVVQECFVYLEKRHYQPLYDAIKKNLLFIAVDKSGCLALNECMTNMEYAYRGELLGLISEEATTLAQEPYGNFVLQHAFGMNETYTNKIVIALMPMYDKLSTIKSASHLVEKCLLVDDHMPEIVRRLMDSGKLQLIAQNEYGNYVIQTAIKVTKAKAPGLYHKLCKKLSQDLHRLESSMFGRKVALMLKERKDRPINAEF